MELSFSRGRVGLEFLPTYEMADVAGGRSYGGIPKLTLDVMGVWDILIE